MPDQTIPVRTVSPANAPIIAVVDDDPAICNSLKFSLELEGFAVHTYPNAAEVLRADHLDRCGCFVIDQRMPGMTGMELIDELRQLKIFTPVVLIISAPNKALSERAAKAAIAIVEKPLLGNALIECIREACGLA